MIYIGLIQFKDKIDQDDALSKALSSFSSIPPIIMRKGALTLCCGKLSASQDLDEIWENESSITLGRIFDKSTNLAFDRKEYKQLSHFDKKSNLRRIWGKYVYFDVSKKDSEFEIILDTTGQLPFFYTSFPDGNILFSSNIEFLYRFFSKKPEYNWEYLCSYLIFGNSSSIQTPFKNIYELPPACALRITRDNLKTSPSWNPLESYKSEDLNKRDAVDILNSALKPWIEPYQNIYVSLSGGLDSSSLVYCLSKLVKKDQNLKAINYFHSNIQTSNELVHARKVCEETKVELIEIDALNSLPFDQPLKKQPLKPNKPFSGLVSLRWTDTIYDHIPSQDPFTLISGHGSDHIFMRPPSKNAPSDFLLENGLHGFKKELDATTHFFRDSLYSIFKGNLKNLFTYSLQLKREKRCLREKLKILPRWIKNDLIKNTTNKFFHPIYINLSRKILPGKYDQIDALYEGLASIHVEMSTQSDPTYYPFLYEPLVEFALSYPTYQLFDKGYDRYPLRQAISHHFKTETVWRRDKSQTTGIFQLGLNKNLEYVLDLCLEGKFVKQGVIDKGGLEQTINLIASGDVKHMWSFLQLASCELFLRDWEEKVYA